MTAGAVPASPLRRELDAAIAAAAAVDVPMTLNDLTVLAVQNDPFRVDTPARHRDGAWLAVQAEELGLAHRTIHLRGLHYALLGRPKPDGSPYTNTGEDWKWLQEHAADAARWLGYIPFDRIVDRRNGAPTTRIFKRPEPWAYISAGIDVTIPAVEDMRPEVHALDFIGVQPHKLVLIGEKSSLDDVLAPIAERYGADLYLPTGECSDTMLYGMARIGAADGRPMVVFYFSDCDPAGWQMPVSVARKLQAFHTLEFPDMEFEVRRVALTPDQVRMYGLPSTPLKATERRADRWIAEYGIEQTEIDALASLRPDLLRRIVVDALAPFHDATLYGRVILARMQWTEAAQQVIDAATGEDRAAVQAEATILLEQMREEFERLNQEMHIDASSFDLPEMVVPVAELAEVTDDPDVGSQLLLDSRWPFHEQCHALIESKAYRDLSRAGGEDR